MRLSLLGIAHPVVGSPFRYKECSGRRRSLEPAFKKKAELWLWYIFCKTCIRILNFNICLY